jgi:hypothetical protein
MPATQATAVIRPELDWSKRTVTAIWIGRAALPIINGTRVGHGSVMGPTLPLDHLAATVAWTAFFLVWFALGLPWGF